MSNRIITAFGSAFIKQDESLYKEIENIGSIIAKKGFTVCSGGYLGTMEAISKGAKSAGGKTIGVTVKTWTAEPNEYVDEVVKMRNLMERIVELIGLADAYVIFRGGTGTLVEISVALEMMNKKAMGMKPLIFYSDYWKNLISTLRTDSESLCKLIDNNVKFANTPLDAEFIINNF
jgi:uncharacterized protein (TIGR00730 family)